MKFSLINDLKGKLDYKRQQIKRLSVSINTLKKENRRLRKLLKEAEGK